jgi:ADP-heptose:LPS heptosyltransferase
MFSEFSSGLIDFIDYRLSDNAALRYRLTGTAGHIQHRWWRRQTSVCRVIVTREDSGSVLCDQTDKMAAGQVVSITWPISADKAGAIAQFFLDDQLVATHRLRNHIALCLLCRGLGDTLCATPAIRKLRRAGDTPLDLYTWHPDLFRGNPHVDNVFDLAAGGGPQDYRFRQTFNTYARNYRLFRFCSDGDDQGIRKKHSVYDLRRIFACDLGFDLRPDQMALEFHADHHVTMLPDKPYVLLNPQLTWASRTWPADTWSCLIDLLNAQQVTVAVLGQTGHADTTGDKGYHDVQGDFIDYREQATLSDCYRLIDNAACFVTLDSGLLHLAGCTDTHIVQPASSIDPYYRAPYRHGSQQYRYHHVAGDCQLYCASDLAFFHRHHGSFNVIPPLTTCLDGRAAFDCQPDAGQVYAKIMEILNSEPDVDRCT